nr:MAG TPA: hypothetical protein [Caudoviricetes sp.]
MCCVLFLYCIYIIAHSRMFVKSAICTHSRMVQYIVVRCNIIARYNYIL